MEKITIPKFEMKKETEIEKEEKSVPKMEKITIPKFEIKKKTKIEKEEKSVPKIDNQENITSTKAEPQKKYRGVSFHRKNKKWIAQATHNGKSKYLGTHDTAERAARVYDAYVLTMIGSSSKTNFPKEELDLTLLPKLRSYKRQQSNELPMFFVQNPLFSTMPYQQPLHGRKAQHPKHARNSFVMYVAERRKRIKAEGLKRPWNGKGNMLNIFSEEWKILPETERLVFKKLAEEDRRRYESEMKTYEDPSVFAYLQNDNGMSNPFQMMGRGGNINNGFTNPSAMKGLVSGSFGENGFGLAKPSTVSENAIALNANKHLTPKIREEEKAKKELSDTNSTHKETMEMEKQTLFILSQMASNTKIENKSMFVKVENIKNHENPDVKTNYSKIDQNSPVTQENQSNQEINNKLKDKGVKHWNVVNALEFLSHHDLKMYEKIFTENCIDGQVLHSIDRQQCEALGIKIFHAPKILRLLQKYAM